VSRIIIDARQYTTTTGRYTFRLIEYLEKIKSDHQFVILLKPEDMKVYTFTNPNFQKLACPHKEFSFDEQLGLLKQINGLKADLVHFAIVQQPILYRGKVVTTIHDLTTARFVNPDKKRTVFLAKQQVFKYVLKRVARKSVTVITPTQFVKDDLVGYTHIDPNKVTVTLESADKITESPTPIKYLQKKRFIMYIGRPTPHKNLPRLIDAFTQLHTKHPDLWLVLAGKKDANYRAIEASLPESMQGRVFFTDFVSEAELRWLYMSCAAYVFPSLSEGFGLPGLEAMHEGAPVISSSATCLPEVYGNAAHYFDPTDSVSMALAIDQVLSNPALRARLIAAGDKRVRQFSWQRMAEQTMAVYDQVLSVD
jgi:glycosyltransferase involved in cell wall biosynthesis